MDDDDDEDPFACRLSSCIGKKRRHTGPRERVTVGGRWSVIVHDWSSLDRPPSVYWKTADNVAQINVFETLHKTLVISNQIVIVAAMKRKPSWPKISQT